MKKSPLVSVIMPVYNGSPFLQESIESVLTQTYKNFEFIIVDDKSIDDSLQVLNTISQSDKRIKVYRNKKHMGVGYTLNLAIAKAKGIYLARMDADDIMATNRLQKQVDFLEKNPDIIAVGSNMYEINEKNQIIGKRTVSTNHQKIYDKMYYIMANQNPTLMINTRLVPKGFNWCKTDGILDDLDLLFKLLQFGKLANIDEFLMYYRIHKNNLSLKNIKKTFAEAKNIRKNAKKNYGYKPSLKAEIIFFLQNLVVSLFPEKYLYLLYKIFRQLNI